MKDYLLEHIMLNINSNKKPNKKEESILLLGLFIKLILLM